jgi:phosphoglycolate phosphatase-like HAD superfamily hydrolase
LGEDLLQQAESVNDRMSLLKQAASTGFQRSIIEEFAGSFQLTRENIDAAREAGENFGRVVGVAVKIAADAATFLGRNLREIVTVLAALAAAKVAAMFIGMAVATVRFATALVAAARGVAILDAAATKTIPGLLLKITALAGGAALAWFGLDDAMAGVTEEADRLAASLDGGTNSVVGATLKSSSAARDLIADLKIERDEMRNLSAAYRESAQAVEDMTEVIEVLRMLRKANIELGTAEEKQVRLLVIEIDRYRKEIEKITEAQDAAAKAAEDASRRQAEAASAMAEPWHDASPAVMALFSIADVLTTIVKDNTR